MGLLSTVGRIGAGVATGGLSEGVNALTGGAVFGSKAQRDANSEAQGLFNVAKPNQPTWQDLRDPSTGLLGGNLKLDPGQDININQDALNELRGIATSAPGTSPWEKMMNDKQGLEQTRQQQEASANNARATARARAQMAMGRGSSAGDARSIAKQGATQYTGQLQDVNRQGELDRLGIGTQAYQQKLGLLQQLPGMEVANAQPQFQNREMDMRAQQYNIDNAVNEQNAKRGFDMNMYNTNMGAWAGAQMGKAQYNQESPGLLGMGGFLGTGLGGNKGILGTGLFGGGSSGNGIFG
jgi:hypothetical protein